MARVARSITNSHGYDFNVGNHEAVDGLLSEQHRTESIWVYTMCTLFNLILPNTIILKVPAFGRCWCTGSTMLVLPCLLSWPWYVNGTLWNKEHGLLWRSCLVSIVLIWSCLICGVMMDVLFSIDKSWGYSSENNVWKLKSLKTYETMGKERLDIFIVKTVCLNDIRWDLKPDNFEVFQCPAQGVITIQNIKRDRISHPSWSHILQKHGTWST